MDIRPYDHATDYARVDRFLVEIFEPGEVFANWLQPRWEYMHYHPNIKELPLDKIGIAEEGGRLIGVVNFEHSLAFNYFQVRPGCDHAKPAMLDYLEANLGGRSRTLDRSLLGLFVNDFDTELTDLVQGRGFRPEPGLDEDHSRFLLDSPIPEPHIPAGFRLQSLADENDLSRVNDVLWRGFDHEGPPPDEEIPGRFESQQAPTFRRDLTIVAVAPDGEYVSYAGMWHVPENRVAYVEPVATDPRYRRMGLGGAAVLETLRRVAAEDAEVAWVGSSQEFYKAIGFTTMFTGRLWVKDLPDG